MSGLHLFEGFGVELEYMIVDAASLDVAPVADRLISAAEAGRGALGPAPTGAVEAEIERGPLSWSNELVLHVIEFKTNGPARSLVGLAAHFQADIGAANALLATGGARLMPGGMHPWMSPDDEMRLWPWEYGVVYETFDRIFDCRGHGWANLQATHLNLPFQGDDEFGRLHAAIRLVLPLLPAVAAASPVMDGAPTSTLDNRLAVYRRNARAVPSVSGRVIPEPVFTRAAYETELLGRIYDDLAPLDPAGVLRHEWVNSRGAIARFDRNAIEIRVLDVQECPRADMAILGFVVELLKAQVAGRFTDTAAQQRRWPAERLADLYDRAVIDGEQARFDDADFLAAWGHADAPGGRATAGELLRRLADELLPRGSDAARAWRPDVDVILQHGPLSRRLLSALGADPGRAVQHRVWAELCEALAAGRLYQP